MRLCQNRTKPDRHGSAAVELAVLLPFMAFLLVIGMDFARVYRHAQVVTNCARNGALYGAFNTAQANDKTGIRAAALADAGDLAGQPKVTSETGTAADGSEYVRVTVSWPFATLTNYPGVPSTMDITRTVQMRVGTMRPRDSVP